ncbi:MAG: DUF3750 domain-containing protein [Woeseiaceae bacterium]|nr:DUF3750 domain-containing protein [Woeseiaceae bacterium]
MKKLAYGFLLMIGLFGASAWVASWAIEPQPFGEARAPDPAQYRDAIIQVYGGDVWGFRGNFAIHTWIATKARGATDYRVYEVVSWNLRRSDSVVRISNRDPDRPWARSPAILLHELRGDEAEALIDRIHEAALSYPFHREYTMWPGPNSNSFTAWVALEVPELKLELPFKAIGQSWMKSEYPALRK